MSPDDIATIGIVGAGDIGSLAESWRIQRDTPGSVEPCAALDLDLDLDLEVAVADAKRYRDI